MDPNRLTQKSQEALTTAQAEARRRGHAETDSEHVLLALLEDPHGLAPRLLTRMGTDTAALREALERHLAGRPHTAGSAGAAPGQLVVSRRLERLLDRAADEAGRLKDEYVSVEHLLLAMTDEDLSLAAGRILRELGVTREALLEVLTQVRGSQRVTSATPEGSYEALEKYGRDLVADARADQARPGHRPGRGDPPRRPDHLSQDQEQPGADRRPRCRQDRDRGGPRPADRARRRPGGPARPDHLRARHGPARGRREVPGRVRGAPQGGPQRGHAPPRGGSCSSSTSCTTSWAPGPPRARWTPATCSSRCWPAASCLHRRDDARRVPEAHREGRRARAPLPARDGRRADASRTRSRSSAACVSASRSITACASRTQRSWPR